MEINILSLGIVAAVLIGYASMMIVALSALVKSIIEREFDVFVISLLSALLLVGFWMFFVGLIVY